MPDVSTVTSTGCFLTLTSMEEGLVIEDAKKKIPIQVRQRLNETGQTG
nr:hypothetical protein [Methylomarinum sp. Ch1-1]MDP4521888.1 hypothetical protein [Methylomarinum sp. Ch1-1]